MRRTPAGWELVGLARQLEDLLNLLAVPPEQHGAAWTPPLDLLELPGRYAVRIDVPGITRRDLRVILTRNRLRVSGRRTGHGERQVAHCHRAERSHGGFYLEIRLPPGVGRAGVTALLRAGVLEITLPRFDDDKTIEVPITEEEP